MLTPKIINITVFDCNHLKLKYETGEEGIFDVTPYISGKWYGKLADKKYFNTVHIVDNGNGIEWADGQDIAPHELYDYIHNSRISAVKRPSFV
jgi:hypothetical protein